MGGDRKFNTALFVLNRNFLSIPISVLTYSFGDYDLYQHLMWELIQKAQQAPTPVIIPEKGAKFTHSSHSDNIAEN